MSVPGVDPDNPPNPEKLTQEQWEALLVMYEYSSFMQGYVRNHFANDPNYHDFVEAMQDFRKQFPQMVKDGK